MWTPSRPTAASAKGQARSARGEPPQRQMRLWVADQKLRKPRLLIGLIEILDG